MSFQIGVVIAALTIIIVIGGIGLILSLRASIRIRDDSLPKSLKGREMK